MIDKAIYVTIIIFLMGITFYSGILTARVSNLEDWRENMRKDMHELSDILILIRVQVSRLVTLTERRRNSNEEN